MVDGSVEWYYLDVAHNQHGPVSAAQLVRLVRGGTIAGQTLIWFSGMADWRPAGQVSELAFLFAPAPAVQPPAPPRGAFAATKMAPDVRMGRLPVGGPGNALIPHFAVWGFFWRLVLSYLGQMLVIPCPWTSAELFRFLVVNTSLPDGRRLTFAGTAGDIWYIFAGMGLLGLVNVFTPDFVEFVTLPIIFLLWYFVLRWICESTGSEDGSVKLAFTGNIWGYLTWAVVILVVLVVLGAFIANFFASRHPAAGWGLCVILLLAWSGIAKGMLGWICENVSGTLQFEFVGGVLGILGMTIVLVLAVMIPVVAAGVVYVLSEVAGLWLLPLVLFIPLPWIMRWYCRWFVSKVRLVEAPA